MFNRDQLLDIAKTNHEALVDIILALQDQVQILTQRVKQLEEQANKSSRNSSNRADQPESWA